MGSPRGGSRRLQWRSRGGGAHRAHLLLLLCQPRPQNGPGPKKPGPKTAPDPPGAAPLHPLPCSARWVLHVGPCLKPLPAPPGRAWFFGVPFLTLGTQFAEWGRCGIDPVLCWVLGAPRAAAGCWVWGVWGWCWVRWVRGVGCSPPPALTSCCSWPLPAAGDRQEGGGGAASRPHHPPPLVSVPGLCTGCRWWPCPWPWPCPVVPSSAQWCPVVPVASSPRAGTTRGAMRSWRGCAPGCGCTAPMSGSGP